CCLGCLKLALREVDERLAAFARGRGAGQRARGFVEREVVRLWHVQERPVNLTLISGPLGIVRATFRCPACGRISGLEYCGEEVLYDCQCGAHLRLTVEPGLAELEGEG
ncbi:MAG: hypothetical protein KAX80_11640, partial [Planctomycetes bacterium]|nr:hypothetical protein [Planctomycetota bacterium]